MGGSGQDLELCFDSRSISIVEYNWLPERAIIGVLRSDQGCRYEILDLLQYL